MRELVVKEYGAIEGGKQTLAQAWTSTWKQRRSWWSAFTARPLTHVWKAITELDQMKQWYMPALVAFEPKVGFETEFSVEHEGKQIPTHLENNGSSAGKKDCLYAGDFPVILANRSPRLSSFLKEKTHGSNSRMTDWKLTMAGTILSWRARTSSGAGTNLAMSWKNSWLGTWPLSSHACSTRRATWYGKSTPIEKHLTSGGGQKA